MFAHQSFIFMALFFTASLAVCPNGWFGLGCHFQCPCENSNHCDPISGFCVCKDGWTGARCEKGKAPLDVTPDIHFKQIGDDIWSRWGIIADICVTVCEPGYWGSNCLNACYCMSSSVSCDPATGQCHCEAGYTGTHCEQSKWLLLAMCTE